MIEAMTVLLRTPGRLIHEGPAVKLLARSPEGGFGVLPNHVDFTSALTPCVLALTEPDGRERVFGIDEGVIVKRGDQVAAAVRRALEGDDLESLRQSVRKRFVEVDENERSARAAVSRLEADIARRFADLGMG